MMKDALEVLRYGRNIWKSSGGGFTSSEELEEYLSDTEDRLRVSLERKIPDQVLSTLWRVSKIARRVSAVADHMSGVFVSQNDIAWETEQAKRAPLHRFDIWKFAEYI